MGTLSIHSVMTTALPAWMATTVRRFAPLTALMSSTSDDGRRSETRSPPIEKPPRRSATPCRLGHHRNIGEQAGVTLCNLRLVGRREVGQHGRSHFAHELPLILGGVANHDQGDIGVAGDGDKVGGIAPLVVDDTGRVLRRSPSSAV